MKVALHTPSQKLACTVSRGDGTNALIFDAGTILLYFSKIAFSLHTSFPCNRKVAKAQLSACVVHWAGPRPPPAACVLAATGRDQSMVAGIACVNLREPSQPLAPTKRFPPCSKRVPF